MTVTLTGTGGHAASPHHAVDPVPVAAEVVLALQSFVARRVPVADPAVVSVTRMETDSGAANVLATAVRLEVNVRASSRGTRELLRSAVPRLVNAIGEAHGCDVQVEWVDSYPVTVNDPAETGRVLELLERRPGRDVVLLPSPAMASEDFAYVLDEVPGALLFLGVQQDGASAPMHSAAARFDDSLLDEHAALLADLAVARLSR